MKTSRIPRAQGLLFVVCLMVIFYTDVLSAAQITWVGGGGDDYWNTAANWVGGVVPANTDTVFFNSTNLDCRLNGNIEVKSLYFTAGFTGSFYGENYNITILENADFSSSGMIIFLTTDSLIFNGTGTQNFTPKSGVLFPIIVQNGSGTTAVQTSGFKAQNLILKSGTFLSAYMVTDTVVGVISSTGGTLGLNSGSLIAMEDVDFSGLQGFSDGTGIISFSAGAQQNFYPNAAIAFPAVWKNGASELIVKGNKLTTSCLKVQGGTVTMDTSLRVDSLLLSPGVTLQLDTMSGNSDTVGYVSLQGNINIRNSELCFSNQNVDLSLLNSITSWINGALAFIGTNQSFIPSATQMYTKIRQRGTGPTTISSNDLRVDTLELISGQLHLGNGLSDSINGAIKMNGGTLNFGSSVLKVGSANLNLSGSGSIVPGTGVIEFSSMSDQYFIPAAGALHPPIVSSSYRLRITDNHLITSKVTVLTDSLKMRTTIKADTITVSNGSYFRFDTTANQYDTVGELGGMGRLEFGKTNVKISGNVDFSSFTSITGTASIDLISSTSQSFTPRQYYTFSRIQKTGTGTVSINSYPLLVNNMEIMGGVWNWSTSVSDTVLDTLSLTNSTMNLGSNSLVLRSLIESSGTINFNNGYISQSGNFGVLMFSASVSISSGTGTLQLNGVSGSKTILSMQGTDTLPAIYKNGIDTIEVQGNVKSPKLMFSAGAWDWGSGNHTIDTMTCSSGEMDFNSALVRINSSYINFENLQKVVPGTGTLELSASSGVQELIPHSTDTLPAVNHTGNAILQLNTNALLCKSFTTTGKGLSFYGYNIFASGDVQLSPSDTIMLLEGRTISAGGNIAINGTNGNILYCNSNATWNVNAGGTLSAKYAVLKFSNAAGSPGTALNSVDSGSNSNWTFTTDTAPPDNDVRLNLTSLDTGSVIIKWNPSAIDSADAYQVGIWYRTVTYPDSAYDGAALLVGTYTMSDTIDTLQGLQSHTQYYFALSVVDSIGNWASFNDSSRAIVITQAQPPTITTSSDTVHYTSFSATWTNPQGLSLSDSIYLHIDTINGTTWVLQNTLGSAVTSSSIVVPSTEGTYKFMISTSFDSAGVNYITDAAYDTVTYIINPPVITTSIDTTDTVGFMISWNAPSGMTVNDSFFIYTDTISRSGGWSLIGKYANSTTTTGLNFQNYGAYSYLIATSWDSLGSISNENVAIDTVYILPSTNIYTWDISGAAGFQIGDGTWGTDSYWTVNGQQLLAWPDSGHTAHFQGSTTSATITVIDTQHVDSIIFDVSGVSLGGGAVKLSSGIIQGNVQNTISSEIHADVFTKKGTGEIILAGALKSNSSVIENGLLTLSGTSYQNNILCSLLVVKSNMELSSSAHEKIGNTTTISLDTVSTWNMNGFSEAVAFLKGAGTINSTTNGAVLYLDLFDAKSETFSGIVTGSTHLYIRGNNAITDTSLIKLTGANTFSGAFGVAAGDSIVNNVKVAVQLAREVNTLPSSSVITFGSANASNLTGVLILGDTATRVEQTISGINEFSGSGTFSIIGGNAAISQLYITNDSSASFSGVIGGNSLYANNLELIKSDTGSLILSGNNSYTGATTVNGGTLYVNGTLASSTVNVSSAVLGGNGSIGGTVTLSTASVVSPGNNSPGKLSVGSLLMSSLCTLNVDIGTLSDTIAVAGNVTLDGVLNVTAGTGFNESQYTIITCSGSVTDNGIIINGTPGGNYSYRISNDSGAIIFHADTIIPDTSAPSVTISYPDSSYFNQVPATVSGLALDDQSGITALSILLLHKNTYEYWNGTSWTDSVQEIPLTISQNWVYTNTMTIREGDFQISAKASDSAGNIAYDTAYFSIDTVSPVAAVITQGVFNPSTWPGYISGSMTVDSSGVDSLLLKIEDTMNSLYWNGAGWDSSEQWNSVNYNVSWSYALAHTYLSASTYKVSVYCTDSAGNVQTVPDTQYFSYDQTGPSVISFFINDTNGVVDSNTAALVLNIADCDSMRFGYVADTLSSSWLPYSGTHTFTLQGTQGTHIIYAQFKDSSENRSGWVMDSTVFDSAAPVVVLSGDNIDSLGSWNGMVSGTASDLISGIQEVSVQIKNSSGHFWKDSSWDSTVSWNNSNGIQTWNYSIPVDSLPSGIYNVKVSAKDSAGNITETPAYDYYQYYSKPAAQYSVYPTSGPAPLSVTLLDSSTGTIASFQWDFGDGSSIDTSQNTTHMYTDPGVYNVTLVVKGPLGIDTGKIAQVTVIDSADSVPVHTISLVPLADTTISEKQLFTMKVTTRKDTDKPITVSLAGNPENCTITNDTITWIPGNDDIGRYSIIVMLKGVNEEIISDTLNVVVVNVPDSPKITIDGPLTAFEDSIYTAVIKISDADRGDTFTIAEKSLPAWLRLNGTTLTGIPVNEDVGFHRLEIICFDKDSLFDTLRTGIQVVNTNDMPVVTSAVIPDTMMEKNEYISIISLFDPDSGDSIIAETASHVSWAKITAVIINPKTNKWDVFCKYLPMQSDTGDKEIVINYADRSGNVATFRKNVIVLDVDDPPQKPVVTSTVSGGAAKITLFSKDDRSTELRYTIAVLKTGSDTVLYSDSSTKTLHIIFPLVDGRYTIHTTAIDNSGLYSVPSIDSFTIAGASFHIWNDTLWNMISVPSVPIGIEYLKNSNYFLNWDESGVDKQVFSFYKTKDEILTLEPSKSYWRKGDKPDTIHLQKGNFINDSVVVTLNKNTSGWNQIASPYPFPVAWTRKDDVLWKWNAREKDYEESLNILEPWIGYWVKVDTSVETVLYPVPVFYTGTLSKLRKTFFAGRKNWSVNVSLLSDNGKDTDNRFGFNPGASDAYDKQDRYEPPRLDNGPVLYFQLNDNKVEYNEFASDIRKNWENTNIFEIALSGDNKRENGILTFDGIDLIQDVYVYMVVDDSVIQVQPGGEYKVPLSKDVSYQTLFVTGDAQFIKKIPLHFKMSNPYPNPFCPSTKMHYTLPYRWDANGKIITNPYVVSIEIFDMMGRKLRQLVYRKMTPGNYTVTWDGKMESGRIVASGNYYCVLSAGDLKSIKQLTLLK